MLKNFRTLLLLILFSPFASAITLTQVYVDSGEVGQGFIIKRLSQCYLVTPEHVIGNEFFANVITGTSKRALGEAEKLQTFGYDLSISLISGAANRECTSSINAFEPIDEKLKQTTMLSVSTVNSDGSKSLIPVTLIDVGLINLAIKTTSSEVSLYKGLSGSVVYANETPVGILQSVDAETGDGVVLRIDRAIETIRPFFASNFQPKRTLIKSPKDVNKTAKSIDYKITKWSHSPISPTLRVANINDGNTETTWAVKPDGNLISLTLDFDNVLQRINGFSLVNTEQNKARYPKDIEILSTRRASGSRGWTTVYSGTWVNSKGLFQETISPIKAKRLKIIFRSNWGSSDSLKVSELTLY